MAPAPREQLVCAQCHKGIDAAYDRALLHAKPGAVTCMSCHHLDLSNDPKKVEAKRVEACKGCHGKLAPTHTRSEAGSPACTACHSIHDDASLAKQPIPSARCGSCHEAPHALHAAQDANGAKDAKQPECVTCHTLHGDKNVQPGFSSITPTCVSCHKRPHPSHPPAGNQEVTCTACHSMASDSAIAAVPQGAALTSVCTSCHKDLPGGHAEKHGAAKGKPAECEDCHSFATDPQLPRAQAAISQRCGSCHESALKEFSGGGHNSALAANGPNRDAPNCVTCHTTHNDTAVASTRLAATQQCIACHSNEKLAKKYDLPRYAGGSYMDDFHGETFGFVSKRPTGEAQPDVLTCADCHGAHAVAWNDSTRVADVCASCHGKESTKLAGAWLGHGKPGPKHQPLVWLIRLFYYVLIPFVLAGLTLHIAFQLIDQRRKGARMRETLRKRFARGKEKVATVTRFTRLERAEHLGSMITFILLVLTGLPQTRPDLEFAHRIIEMFGGITTLRWIHRITGLIFVALLVQHVARAVVRVFRTHRLPIMATSIQDFKDAFATVKHFIWGTPRPKTGKFDFSEKFEYWGLFMGGTLMSVTGIALLFPELLTQYVPGLFVALFRVMHGLEATFAVLVVALWHSYGVILRPEVFPLDTSIFTGEMPVERLEEEHRLEYERLFPDGHEQAEEEEEEEEVLVG